MDPFSHLLLGYLLGFGIWGASGLPFVLAAAVAGALPDADIALYPLSKRFPLLRHRGISHSLVGVTVIAVVGAFVVPDLFDRILGPPYGAGGPVPFFVAMEVGGLSHVLLDAMDHWSVPILAPFSDHEYRFDADRIVNVGSMAFTVVAYGLLLAERGRAPVWLWAATSLTLLGLAGGYLVVRLFTRWRAGAGQRREGFRAVVPQGNPLRFLLVTNETQPTGHRFRIGWYDLLRDRVTGVEEVHVAAASPATGVPVRSVAEAMACAYEPSLRASWMLGETWRFARGRELPGCFEVFWYSLEFTFWGRSAGVLARVDAATGAVTTEKVWRAPGRVFGSPP